MGKISDALRGIPLDVGQKQKVVSLDREFENMEAEVEELNVKCLHLEAQVKPLEAKVKRLEQRLEEQAASEADKGVAHLKLDETQEHILHMLMSVKERECTTQNIARALEVGTVRAEVYLNRLQEHGLIGQALNLGNGPSYWFLQERGKKYVVDRELDKR